MLGNVSSFIPLAIFGSIPEKNPTTVPGIMTPPSNIPVTGGYLSFSTAPYDYINVWD